MGEYSSGWPKICRILSRVQWRFVHWISGKNYFGRIFHIFSCKPSLSSNETCEIWPYYLHFLFCVHIALKKFPQVLSYVVCTQERRHVHKRITKRIYEEEKPAFILVWIFFQTFFILFIDFWLWFEPQILATGFAINFLFITARAERKVHLCVKLFDFFVSEYSSVWPETYLVLSKIQLRFLRIISGKKLFRSYYALLLGYFGLKFLSDVCHCVYWVLAEIWAPDSSHRIRNNFFIHHCQDWKEGSFACEIVWFFSWVYTHSFDLKFVAFFPEISGYSYIEFQEKLFRKNFSEIFAQTKAIYT